jgi:DNA-directed RNA polymerase subunit RPC12/RpoP
MPGYRDTQKREWMITAALLVLFVLLLTAGAIWLAPRYLALFLLLGVVSIILLVLWHNRTFAYRCSNCGHEFEITALRNFISPHGIDREGGWKYLKCPDCGVRNRARVIAKV